MAQYGVVLASSSAVGAFTGSTITWPGGRSVLVLNAAQYGASVQLQVQHLTGVWVAVNGTTYSADQVTGYDMPAGQVRMASTGSSAGMNATLMKVRY